MPPKMLDIYAIELTAVESNSDLKRLLAKIILSDLPMSTHKPNRKLKNF